MEASIGGLELQTCPCAGCDFLVFTFVAISLHVICFTHAHPLSAVPRDGSAMSLAFENHEPFCQNICLG